MRNVCKSIISLLIAGILLTFSYDVVFAKGLDSLEPQTGPDADDFDESKSDKPKDGAADSEDENEDEDSEEDTENAEENAEKKEPEKPAEPSYTSRKMADRVFLSSGLGFVAGSKLGTGKTSALVAPDVNLAVLLTTPTQPLRGVWGSLRYQPLELVIRSDNMNYRGVAESYMLGAHWRSSLWAKTEILGGAEVGYTALRVRQFESFKDDLDVPSGGFSVLCGGGMDWLATTKVYWGPRLYVMAGYIQTVKVAFQGSFLF